MYRTGKESIELKASPCSRACMGNCQTGWALKFINFAGNLTWRECISKFYFRWPVDQCVWPLCKAFWFHLYRRHPWVVDVLIRQKLPLPFQALFPSSESSPRLLRRIVCSTAAVANLLSVCSLLKLWSSYCAMRRSRICSQCSPEMRCLRLEMQELWRNGFG